MKQTLDRDYYAQPSDSELPLFADVPVPAPAKPRASRQQQELNRVTGKTAYWIKQFFDAHQVGEQFHAEDLHRWVRSKANVAPASADRVMRDMKARGTINYDVVSRSHSLYRKLALGMPTAS